MDDQAAQQHGGGRIAGDAQGQQRDHRAADGGIVGRFRGHNTVNNACTKFLRIFGLVFYDGIGKDVRGRAANARQDADAHTNQSRNQEIDLLAQELLHCEAEALPLELHYLTRAGDQLLLIGRSAQNLGNGIQSHKHCQDVESAPHARESKGIAVHCIDGSCADSDKHDAQSGRNQAFNQGLARQTGNQSQRENRHGKILCRSELQGKFRDDWRDKDQHQDAENGA